MCRGLILLHNIENTTIDELLVFMKRRLKLCMIFFVIEIVTFIAAQDYHPTYITFTAVTLALYLVNMGSIFRFQKNPTSRNALLPIISAVAILAFNVFDMTYTLVRSHNYWALFTLISIFIQISTLIVIHKLRVKLLNREQGREDDDIHLEQPIENNSTHSSTHGGARKGGNANGSAHGERPDIENPMSRS
jgi:hypothetical protein